ncbi:MAG: NADH-quinone oxidoreductase subunit NuoE [Nitrospirota bacterium]
MLTEEEKQEILTELAHVEHREAASVEALKIVQKHRRWVSDESIRDIAPLLDMTPAELDAVATFYAFIYRKPVGRHVIQICDSMVCWTTGYESLYGLLGKKLGIGFGGSTQDRRFTLLPASCLGACDRAPAMLVDEDLYGPVTPEMLDGILERYR